MPEFDVIVIGAGIAGVSIAAELARDHRVLLLEAERQPAYHSTGRSAAMFILNYGNGPIRTLNAASRPFFETPPAGFSEQPLLSARGFMIVASGDGEAAFEQELAGGHGLVEISVAEARRRVPALRPEWLARAAVEDDARDIDVHALHTGYLRWMRNHGGMLVTDAGVQSIVHRNDGWVVHAAHQDWRARRLVNAAGAWADRVAELAGLEALGLQPLRRSAAIVSAGPDRDVSGWPLVANAREGDHGWYCRPDAGRLMVSPADEVPVEPHDAFVDDMILAEGIDRFQQAMAVEVHRVEHSWAGLRTFARDRTPVAGADPRAPGFFWLAGQGGYGIQTAPAMAMLGRALLCGEPLPEPLLRAGVDPAALAPGRLLESP